MDRIEFLEENLKKKINALKFIEKNKNKVVKGRISLYIEGTVIHGDEIEIEEDLSFLYYNGKLISTVINEDVSNIEFEE